MEILGFVLVVVAAVLVVIDLASGRRPRDHSLLLPIALLLVCIALGVFGVTPFAR